MRKSMRWLAAVFFIIFIIVFMPSTRDSVHATQRKPDAEHAAQKDSVTIVLIDTGVTPEEEDPLLERVSLTGGDGSDDAGHGTRMYRLIRDMAPEVKILSLKAMDEEGTCSSQMLAAAILSAMEREAGVICIPASAQRSEGTAVVEKAIEEAAKKGIKVVCAAGNEGKDSGNYVPGCVFSATVTGACEPGGILHAGSNFGASVDCYVVAESTSEAAAKLSAYTALELAAGVPAEEREDVYRTAVPAEEREDACRTAVPAEENAASHISGEEPEEDTFHVDWALIIKEDITDGDYLSRNLGMYNVTRQRVLRTARENWSSGLKYKDSEYDDDYLNVGTCINYGSEQYSGTEKHGYGYNCSGFVASVLYYANGGPKENALKNMIEYYKPLKQGRTYYAQSSFSDSSGWYYFFNGVQYPAPGTSTTVTRTNMYYLGEVNSTEITQEKLNLAERAGKLKEGYLIYYWPVGGTDCHVGVYAGKSTTGEHMMYHAVGRGHYLCGRMGNMEYSAVMPLYVSYLYIIPLPEEPNVSPNSWHKDDMGRWLYYDESKMPVTGWKEIDGKWYYFDISGEMQTGWKWIRGSWYYLKSTGVMHTGWKKSGKYWYFLNRKTGAMEKGFTCIGRQWYCFKSNGVMAGNEYWKGLRLDSDGVWRYKAKARWVENTAGFFYLDDKGWYAKSQMIRIDNKKKSFDTKGYCMNP